MKKIKIQTSKVFIIILAILLFVLLGMKFYNFILQKTITNDRSIIAEQNTALKQYEQMPEIKKWDFIDNFSSNFNEMPRSEHIIQVLKIFESLKDVDDSSNEAITLSDFKVTLNEIELKWTVSSLKVLYYNSPNWNFKSLIDRFTSLDFIQEMNIKQYEKNWLWFFEFTLSANVINNGK